MPAHKVAGIRHAIEARGATLLYLPPYSPDFNPIENAFAKLKAYVRKHDARTIDVSKQLQPTLFDSSDLPNAPTSSHMPDTASINRNPL
jgi:transposase